MFHPTSFFDMAKIEETPKVEVCKIKYHRNRHTNICISIYICEESVSGTGLCNTSSYMACIWLKATGQEVIHLTAEDFIASLDIDRCPVKSELSIRCCVTATH